MSKLRVWLELSRGANLPTVWSNVFMGWLIAVAFGGTVCVHELGWILLSASFLYVAGMFLNDAADVEWDRKHFPDRPIPAGKIKLGHVQQAGGSDHEAARKDGRVSRDRGSAAAGSAEHDRRHTDRHESQIDRLTAKI